MVTWHATARTLPHAHSSIWRLDTCASDTNNACASDTSDACASDSSPCTNGPGSVSVNHLPAINPTKSPPSHTFLGFFKNKETQKWEVFLLKFLQLLAFHCHIFRHFPTRFSLRRFSHLGPDHEAYSRPLEAFRCPTENRGHREKTRFSQ